METFKERVARGLCGNCGRPADRDGTICVRCNNTKKSQYQKKKRNKICTICREKHSGKGVRCDNCCGQESEERRLKSNCGVCIRCSSKATRGVYCNTHYVQRKANLIKRFEQGRCLGCGKPRLDNSKYCWECWIKQASRKTKTTEKFLVSLWDKQNGRCAYSGRVLVPGLTAQLDHKVAKRKGGSNDFENLQWVDKDVNYAKRALSEQEFLDLVKDIYRHRCK